MKLAAKVGLVSKIAVRESPSASVSFCSTPGAAMFIVPPSFTV